MIINLYLIRVTVRKIPFKVQQIDLLFIFDVSNMTAYFSKTFETVHKLNILNLYNKQAR